MIMHRGTPETVAARVRAKAGEIAAIGTAIAPHLEEMSRLNVDLALLLREVDPGDTEVDALARAVRALSADMHGIATVLSCCRELQDYGLDRVVLEAMRKRAEGGNLRPESEANEAVALARSVA